MHPDNPTRTIQFKRIKAGSLFKLILIIIGSLIIPFSILCGVAAFFGAHTVTINQEYATGLSGLIAALIMAPLVSVIFAAIISCFAYAAIRIIGRFKPLSISYVPTE